MHFSWNKNKPAFLVECNFNVYAFKITAGVQSEPTTDRPANGLFGFSFLNPIMLSVGLDNFSFDNFVVGIHRIERCFNRPIWSLKNHLAFFMPLDVFKNMLRGVLQPILRPAALAHFCLLKVHNPFNDCVGQDNAPTPPSLSTKQKTQPKGFGQRTFNQSKPGLSLT